jgi:4-cresol dehydrogenase (hydroxylating) flavoprotein subunit
LLGRDWVLTGEADIARYARTCSSSSREALAILKPKCRDQVVEIVKIARRHKTPLYPISTGQNWGYGDACPVRDGQVILDLSRMNRIHEVDAELGYAVIEPGVTQRQLSDYLAAHQIPFWCDCTGAGPNSSFIGNIVERGFGHTPYGNRLQTVSGMEVVLGTGEVLQTGFGHYPNAKTTYLYPYGVGPFMDGLFTQSNFGIVTRIGLWLLPIPESFCPYLVLFQEDEDLFRALPQLQRLRMQRILHSVPHIGNDLRALSTDKPFPRDRFPGTARLTPELRAELRQQAGIGAWAMSGAFYGTGAQVRLHRRLLKRALRGVKAKVIFLPAWLLRLAQHLVRLFDRLGIWPSLGKKIRAAQALADMHSGRPTGFFLRGAFWRKQEGWPADLSDNTDLAGEQVGILWMAPILPFRTEDLASLTREMDALFARYDFDCHVTVNMINERALAAVYTIDYDAEDAEETARALACYEEGVGKLYSSGISYLSDIAAGDGSAGTAGGRQFLGDNAEFESGAGSRQHHCAGALCRHASRAARWRDLSMPGFFTIRAH